MIGTCTAEKFRLHKKQPFWQNRKNHVLFIQFEYKQKMTGPQKAVHLVFVSFFFLFILRRSENNNKYNRIALFAGRRKIRIMNYQ